MKFYLQALKAKKLDQTTGKKVKNPDEYYKCYIFMTVATISVFLNGAFSRRSSNFVGVIRGKGGQTLRSLIYKKLCEADFLFLETISNNEIANLI